MHVGISLQKLLEIEDGGQSFAKTACHLHQAFLDAIRSGLSQSSAAFDLVRARLIRGCQTNHSLSVDFWISRFKGRVGFGRIW